VDNCLYSESEIQDISGNGIEKQIIQNTHDFGRLVLNLTKDECDEMYQQYGSTIEGIRHKLLSEGLADDRVHELLQQYYCYVYDRIDMTCLLPNRHQTVINTGYNHARSRLRQEFIREMLQSMPYPIYFASNSPKRHVLRVLSAMGLKNVDYDGLLTPDALEGQIKYPTKFQPAEFFKSLLEQYGSERLILIDDSKTNIQKAKDVGIQGIVVNHDNGVTLEQALSVFVGHVENKSPGSSLVPDSYEFSDVKYLQSKYNVDMEAINPRVWDKMIERLFSNRDQQEYKDNVRIVDIGAGLLSMLDLIIMGVKEKQPLIERMTSGSVLHYIAYESNESLLDAIHNRVRSLGFVSIKTEEKDEYVYILQGKVTVKLVLRVKDFTQEKLGSEERPDIILGCCFADLFDPNELVTSVAQFVNYYTGDDDEEQQNSSPREILLYFPITFSGTTQFVTPHPFEIGVDQKVIPSDTLAFRLYSQNLIEQHGHNLDPIRLIEAFENIGASLLEKGQSVWHIDPYQNAYLWKTMLHFFRNSAAFEIMKCNLDSVGWLKRAERASSPIRVMNQDLLLSLPLPFSKNNLSNSISENFYEVNDIVEEIVFIAPYKVGKNVKRLQENHLEPNQVEGKLKILHSCIADVKYINTVTFDYGTQ
jgi:FMN phosphatase YigB (HAD superfamily)